MTRWLAMLRRPVIAYTAVSSRFVHAQSNQPAAASGA